MVFLSYAREDASLVSKLERELLEFGVAIVKDAPKAESDPLWRENVAQLLASASAVLIFWTKNAIASPWVDQEIRSWKGMTTIWFRNDASPVPRFRSAGSVICNDWRKLVRTLRPFTRGSSFRMNREGEGLAEPSYTQRLEADKRAKETLTAFRRHRFRPRPLARVEEHSLYDQHEGLLFREIRPGVYIAECSVTRNQYQRFVAETGFPANRYVQKYGQFGEPPSHWRFMV